MCNGVVFVPEGAAAKGQTNKSNGIQKQDAKCEIDCIQHGAAFGFSSFSPTRALHERVSLFQRFPLKIGNQCAESTSPPEAHLLNFTPPLHRKNLVLENKKKKLRVIKKSESLVKKFHPSRTALSSLGAFSSRVKIRPFVSAGAEIREEKALL